MHCQSPVPWQCSPRLRPWDRFQSERACVRALRYLSLEREGARGRERNISFQPLRFCVKFSSCCLAQWKNNHNITSFDCSIVVQSLTCIKEESHIIILSFMHSGFLYHWPLFEKTKPWSAWHRYHKKVDNFLAWFCIVAADQMSEKAPPKVFSWRFCGTINVF